jgi:VWFA-related protein
MRRAATFIVLALAAGGEQQFKYSATANLVIVNVSVGDRSGKPIEGLKKEDFTVLEDGQPQTVAVFEFQKLTAEPLPLAPPPLSRALYQRPEVVEEPAIRRPNPGEIIHQNRRLLVMFFDFTSMPPADQIRAQEAALKFLGEQMTAADLISIMTFSNRLKVEQDFTDDREALGEIIRGFRIGEMSELAEAGATGEDEEAEDEANTLFIADETEFNIFNTDRKLSALESAVRNLAVLPERKALVYFSSGVGKTGVENQSQLRATINEAVRSNVSFYPIDVRGLVALPPGGDASRAAPRGTAVFSGRAQVAQRAKFNDEQETLYSLAADTGGKALLDSNDLTIGIQQVQKDVRSYYILGYYTTNPAQDGRYRRIQVRLAAYPQARVEHRQGYFASKEYRYFTAADKERQLEDALLAGDPVTDLPLALEVDHFRISADRYFVPVAVKIPGSEIALTKRGSSESAEFDFIGQVRDPKKKLAGSVRDTIRVRLNESDAAQLNRRSLHYDTGFTLAPGEYRIKFLARENQSGKMGTFETKFTVPDLKQQNTSLRLSSVVLGSQREPITAAVGAADRKDKEKLQARHPLIAEGKKLIPSITRVFRKDQSLYVYFEVYDPAAAGEQHGSSVVANLSFYRGRAKAFESAPLRRTAPSRPNTIPFEFQVPLEKMKPGRYTCQVNAIDEVGRKFAFPRAEMVLLP